MKAVGKEQSCLTTICGFFAWAISAPVSAQEVQNRVIGTKIGVADLQRSVDFYKHLGMEVGRKPNAIEWELKSAADPNSAVIYIVKARSGTRGLQPGVGFVMMGVTNVREVAAKLRAAGYPDIGEPRISPQFALLFAADPDGNTVELIGPGEK